MNAKALVYWLLAALVLFALVVANERFGRKELLPPPKKVLPQLKPGAVKAIQVRPKGQLEIRAERGQSGWKLTEPLAYPAQSAAIEALLTDLENLVPAAYITAKERAIRPKADEEDGFVPPQATIIIEQGDYRAQLWVGSRTAPGDQIFLQVVGVEGVYVVDASLLKSIPLSGSSWRDLTLFNLKDLAFDRISVTNGPRLLELKKEGPALPWRMMTPIQARADDERIETLLQKLAALRVEEFVTDDPKADLEALGLQPPELQVALALGTNTIALLATGKSPTNDARQVYARKGGQSTIVKVSKELIDSWHVASVNDFRDPHLLSYPEALEAVEIKAADNFTLLRQTNNSWRVVPQNFPADAALVQELVSMLCNLRIVEFSKDVVTAPALPAYGLAEPARQFILRTPTQPSPGITNPPVYAAIDFGTNHNDKVYVRRTDESSVYAVALADFHRLPSASVQFRDRQIWNFSEDEVERVTIRQDGKVRQMLRKGPHEWSLAPGSQGIINPLAVEETVRMLARLSAASWLGRGEECRGASGFTEASWQVALELKEGRKAIVDFAPGNAAKAHVASVVIDGEPWLFEFPASLYPFVSTYLIIPADPS